MANKNFVVHNGLEVGPVKIFAGNGEILTTGNITSTSATAITTTYVQKIALQFPSALGSPSWYKIGTFSINSGVGAGHTNLYIPYLWKTSPKSVIVCHFRVSLSSLFNKIHIVYTETQEHDHFRNQNLDKKKNGKTYNIVFENTYICLIKKTEHF